MKKLSLLSLALLASLSFNAFAAEVEDSFRVSIEILESCTVSVAAADVDFGQTDRSSTGPINASSTLSVNCTPGTPWALGLDNGLNGSSPTTRRMTNGTEFVGYGLFRDAGRSQVFGAADSADRVSNTGTGAAQSVPVYGQVVGAQTNVAAGIYQDTVVAKVIY